MPPPAQGAQQSSLAVTYYEGRASIFLVSGGLRLDGQAQLLAAFQCKRRCNRPEMVVYVIAQQVHRQSQVFAVRSAIYLYALVTGCNFDLTVMALCKEPSCAFHSIYDDAQQGGGETPAALTLLDHRFLEVLHIFLAQLRCGRLTAVGWRGVLTIAQL